MRLTAHKPVRKVELVKVAVHDFGLGGAEAAHRQIHRHRKVTQRTVELVTADILPAARQSCRGTVGAPPGIIAAGGSIASAGIAQWLADVPELGLGWLARVGADPAALLPLVGGSGPDEERPRGMEAFLVDERVNQGLRHVHQLVKGLVTR